MIYIALGSNLCGRFETPEAALACAKQVLSQKVTILKTSSIWLTSPVPASDQPDYRNAVVAVDTDLAPQELLKALKKIEADLGRTVDIRNAPRVVDLDIIDYKSQILETDTLILPHPRMHSRAFVLKPLQEIAPLWQHPANNKTLQELLEQADQQDTATPIIKDSAW